MNIDVATASLGVVLLVQTAGVAFFIGKLSEKVATAAAAIKALQTGEDAEGNRRSDVIERLVRLETKTEGAGDTLTKVEREMRGMSRQMAALVTHGRPGIANFMDAQSDG